MAVIQAQMPAVAVDESDFAAGNWTAELADLLDLAGVRRDPVNGSEQIGRFIEKLLP